MQTLFIFVSYLYFCREKDYLDIKALKLDKADKAGF